MVSAEVVNGGGGDHLKKKNEEDMVQKVVPVPYLGEDIITQILLKIPAESLFKTLRYVCKSWLNMISTHPDIHLNRLLPSKPPCLIIQNVDYKENNFITCFFTLSKEGKIIEQFDDLNPVMGNLWIRACCNGLILATTFRNPTNVLHVVNPLTNHRLIIPYPGSCTAMDLVFIPSTGEYKVIAEGFLQGNKFIRILTLSASDCYGSSSSSSSNDRLQWRLIEAPKQILLGPVVAINGILYWHTCASVENETTCAITWSQIFNGGLLLCNFVSFDASVEKFYEPTCHNNKKASKLRHLGLIEIGGLPSSCSFLLEEYDDVWRFNVRVVKDFHGGEWVDKYSIPIDRDFMELVDQGHHPVLSFGNGEVIIFHSWVEKTMWALNVKLNQWWKVGNRNLKENSGFRFQGFHVNNKTVPLESIFAME